MAVDDAYCSPVGVPNLKQFVEGEFACPRHDPDNSDDNLTYERLGGVLFLNPEASGDGPVEYRVDFVENPNALPVCALPSAVSSPLVELRDKTALRNLRA